MVRCIKNLLAILIFLLFSQESLRAQPTVGVLESRNGVSDGYVLFGPINSKNTYLIDVCGRIVNQWQSAYENRLVAYLSKEGRLIRAGGTRQNGVRKSVVEILDWESRVLWSFSPDTFFGLRHHDIELLPNGNLLLLVEDRKSGEEVRSVGGITNAPFITSEQILEVRPDLVNGAAEIVWRWKAWDHLVQDQDSAISNFAKVSGSPDKINLNYLDLMASDWLHFNSIDYHPARDEIMVSSRHFNEIWVIDHSTTSEEASDSMGGSSGQGGDILYRWGNPAAYGKGGEIDRKLFFQHDAQWISSDEVLLFNNDAGIPENRLFSSIMTLILPLSDEGAYVRGQGAFGPSAASWTYVADPPEHFYSNILSGVQRLENGHTFICEGVTGRFFEIDNAGDVVWEYMNPVGIDGPAAQGENPRENTVFKCQKYPMDFPGFRNRDLAPGNVIEITDSSYCDIVTNISYLKTTQVDLSVFPNPAREACSVEVINLAGGADLRIYDIHGREVFRQDVMANIGLIELTSLQEGIYIATIMKGAVLYASTRLVVY